MYTGWRKQLAPVSANMWQLLPAIRSLERMARYLFYCRFFLFVCLFFLFGQRFLSNPRADSCQSSQADVAWVGTSLLPFWGLAAPGGRKKGKWNFRYYGSQWGIYAFWRFLSDISATRARIHTKYYLCRNNVCRRAPPLWGASAPGGAEEGELKTQKMGVVSFLLRTATIFIFISDAKCGPICRAKTCAHSGVEPSRSTEAILQGGPKSSKKFRIFHHFYPLRPYISESIKNRGI